MKGADAVKTALREAGVPVFMPGEHPGVCVSPYCVVQPLGQMSVGRFSHGTGIVRVNLYAPAGRFHKLEGLWNDVDEVLAALSRSGVIRYNGERGACLIDDAFRAVTCFADVTVQFGKRE